MAYRGGWDQGAAHADLAEWIDALEPVAKEAATRFAEVLRNIEEPEV